MVFLSVGLRDLGGGGGAMRRGMKGFTVGGFL